MPEKPAVRLHCPRAGSEREEDLGLRFDPIGGGQFKQAIKTIIEAESQPIQQLEARKVKEQSRLKLFQDFKTRFSGIDKALGDISNFTKFRELKAELGDGANLASVTIDKDKAQPGTWNLEIQELAARTSVISNGFEDADEKALGTGFIVMNGPNGQSKEIFIDEDKSSLHGVAQAINQQSDSPIRASVIKDSSDSDAPFKLILTAKKEGGGNQIDIPDFYFMDGDRDLDLDDRRDAKNASMKVDGFPIEVESNDINDFLPGVNLHLKQAKPDSPFSLTISEDYQKVTGKVKTVIDQVNSIFQFITKQNTLDKDTDTSSSFAGDTSLTNIEYRLRNLMHEGFPVGNPDDEGFRWIHLNELGVEFDKTGQLSFKEDKFQKAVEKDFDGIAEAITGDFGFATQMRQTINSYTRSGDGMLGIREKGINERIKQYDSQIEQKTKRLEQRQQSLTEQFSRLEGSMANMQLQLAALSAMGGGGGGGGSMVQQLLGG
jgi:flagellar hook-associated protein 2